MEFKDYFKKLYEAEEVENVEEFDPKEIEIGMEEENEHRDVYEVFEKFAKDNGLELPIDFEEFKRMTVLDHLRESSNYYTKLKDVMDNASEMPVEESVIKEDNRTGLTYDVNKMSDSVDAFVRYLIGDNKNALNKLQKLNGIDAKGLVEIQKQGNYNKLYAEMYKDFYEVVINNLGYIKEPYDDKE